MDYRDKTVLITGASKGVGAACARAFAAAGARLALVARGEADLQKLADELATKTDVLPIVADVGDSGACELMLAQTRERFGGLHVLVNNAGTHSRGEVTSVAIADLGQMVDVNLRAPVVLSALAAPMIKASGGGAIVMVGSLAGRTPMQGAATYGATKAGLRSFTYAMAEELAPQGVRVGLVSPGPIDTGFIMDEIDEVEDIVFSQEMSTAAEVAQAVIAVANGESQEICMPASGGLATHLSYLSPALRRKMRPALYRKGKKNKEKYRNRG